jgi:iron complex outermembrane receptor protein
VQRAEDGVTGRELSSSPRQLGKINVSIPIYKDRLFSSVELQYHGSVKTLDGTGADGFLVTNLTLFNQRMVKGLALSASLYNAFDTKYGYPGAEDHLQNVIEQNGRTVRATLTYGF